MHQNIRILTPPLRSSGENMYPYKSIICWHSNIIWMTFWTILWSLKSYLASQYRLTPSKSQNVKILTSQSVFHPKKLTYTHSETNRVILLRFQAFQVILGLFWVILGIRDVTKGSRFSNFVFLTLSFVFPPQLHCPCSFFFRSKQSFYRVFWHFRWFSGHFGSFWGSELNTYVASSNTIFNPLKKNTTYH